MKKQIGLMITVLTALSLVGCGGNKNSETPSEVPSTQPSETVSVSEADPDYGKYDEARFAKTGYTLNDYITSTTSLQWNPLTWETSDDSAVLGYISSTLYDYQLNATKDGYEIVPELASALPVDVTAQYAGKFNVADGDSKKAWRIALNPDVTWDNGDKVTADDYIFTMQQQLDQEQLNRRADSFYGGSFSIVNAKNYLYSGKESYSKLSAKNYANVDAALAGGLTVDDLYIDCWGFWGAKGYTDAAGNECPQYVKVTDEVVYGEAVKDAFSGKTLYENFLAPGAVYASYGGTYCFICEATPVTTWDQVGFLKIDDYTIDIILEGEMEEPTEFYLPYNFSSVGLVHKATFESAWEDKQDGTRVNNYNLKLEYTRSYGPYKLTYFENGKQLKFERNEEWYGYKKGVTNGAEAHDGQYQTSTIVWDVLANHATALLAFESGQVDSIGLQSEDLPKYGTSDYLVYTPQSYTTKVSWNTDLESLEAMEATKGDGKNRTIQTIKEFREALSFAIDREDFAKQFTSAAAAGYGMVNYMYQYFNEDGSTSAYRNSDAAKEAMVKLYGLTYGAGTDYETLDEAYAAITGYDMKKAKALLEEAYTKAKDAGVYEDGEEIEIQFNVYSNDTVYTNMVNYFDTKIKEAAVGTPLEGKISFAMYVDDDYYNTMYAGNAQFIYTTWGGASYGTFGVLANCYCDDSTGGGNQMEIGFDTSKVDVTINVDDEDYTFSLQAWAFWMNNDYAAATGGDAIQAVLGKLADYDPEVKCEMYAALEYAYLSSYVTIPVYYRQTASLYSKKINYGSSEYIDLIGFGGVRHITYNKTDAEWAEFIKNADNLKY